MAHKRIEFTEAQKAEIYSRDRATCAFSGISLWFLDFGIRSNWQVDWVDHILPSAAGGNADLTNGICASQAFNAKKRDNTADNVYFVQDGRITKKFVEIFGTPSNSLLEQLDRLKSIEPADWYFNRCLSSLFVGFDWRCNVEFNNKTEKRDDMYWFKSAWKRLQLYNKKRQSLNILERGLVKKNPPFGTLKLLELETIVSQDEFFKWIENIYPIYRESYKIMNEYFALDSNGSRRILLEKAKDIKNLHPEVVLSLNAHLGTV